MAEKLVIVANTVIWMVMLNLVYFAVILLLVLALLTLCFLNITQEVIYNENVYQSNGNLQQAIPIYGLPPCAEWGSLESLQSAPQPTHRQARIRPDEGCP